MIYGKNSYVSLISQFTSNVVHITNKNHTNTESTFHLAHSLAASLNGKAKMSPIHIKNPIATTAATFCTLSTTSVTMVRKSDLSLSTFISTFGMARIQIDGLQSSKLFRISPLNVHSACEKGA